MEICLFISVTWSAIFSSHRPCTVVILSTWKVMLNFSTQRITCFLSYSTMHQARQRQRNCSYPSSLKTTRSVNRNLKVPDRLRHSLWCGTQKANFSLAHPVPSDLATVIDTSSGTSLRSSLLIEILEIKYNWQLIERTARLFTNTIALSDVYTGVNDIICPALKRFTHCTLIPLSPRQTNYFYGLIWSVRVLAEKLSQYEHKLIIGRFILSIRLAPD